MVTYNKIKIDSVIIDVRSPMEFARGSAPGSINIPLNEIPDRLEEFQKMQGTLVICCASGNRSGQACLYLKANDIEAVNGGSWHDVQSLV